MKNQIFALLLIMSSQILWGQDSVANGIDTFEISELQYFDILNSDSVKYNFKLTRKNLGNNEYEVCYPDGVFKSLYSLIFEFDHLAGNEVCFNYNYVSGIKNNTIQINNYDEVLEELIKAVSDSISNYKLSIVYKDLTKYGNNRLNSDLSAELKNIHSAENSKLLSDTSKVYYTPMVYEKPDEEIEMNYSTLDTLNTKKNQRFIVYKKSLSNGRISKQKLTIFPQNDKTINLRSITNKFRNTENFNIEDFNGVFLFRNQIILDEKNTLKNLVIEHYKKDENSVKRSKYEIIKLN